MLDYAALPGGDLIEAGLADLARGVRDTPEALLVAAAGSRLRAAGVPVPEGIDDPDAPLALYHALQPEHGNDAHSRYNALLGQLASFASAAEHATRR